MFRHQNCGKKAINLHRPDLYREIIADHNKNTIYTEKPVKSKCKQPANRNTE